MNVVKIKYVLLTFLFFSGNIYNYCQDVNKQNINRLTDLSKNKELTFDYRAKSLDTLVQIYTKRNLPDSALLYAKLLNALAKENSSGLYVFKSSYSIGNIMSQGGKFQAALEYLYESIKSAVALGDSVYVSDAYFSTGVALERSGSYDEALKMQTNAVAYKIKINDLKGLAGSYSSLGTINWRLGQYSESLKWQNAALAINEKIKNKAGMASCYGNMGIVHSEQGNLSAARDNYNMAIDIFRNLGLKKGVATSQNSIGNLLKDQGNFQESLKYLNEALRVYDSLGDEFGKATINSNIGITYFRMRQFEKSLSFHKKSLDAKIRIGDKRGIVASYSNMGNVYGANGKYDEAVDCFTNAVKISEELNNPAGLSMALSNLSNAFFKKGLIEKSLEHSKRAYQIALSKNLQTHIKYSCVQIHMNYFKLGNVDSALFYLNMLNKNIYSNVKRNYFSISENEKPLFLKTIESEFEKNYEFASAYGSKYPFLIDTAYNTSLRIKGLSLKSSTALRNSIIKSNDTSLINRFDYWLNIKKRIVKAIEAGKDYKDDEALADKIEREIVNASAVYKDFYKLLNLKWTDVQAGLKSGEAAIEFVIYETNIDSIPVVKYAGIVIKKESKHPELFHLCNESELIEILGFSAKNSVKQVYQLYGTKNTPKTALYEKIWKPLEPALNGVKNVYISPAGLLHKISFSAISKSKGVFLSDVYNLHRVSCTGQIMSMSGKKLDLKDKALLVGSVYYSDGKDADDGWKYLQGTLTETNEIKDILKGKVASVNLVNNEDATEQNVKKMLEGASIVHIATHGFFYDDPFSVKNLIIEEESSIQSRAGSGNYISNNFVYNKSPLMRSGLVLAGSNKLLKTNSLSNDMADDGILTSQEVSNLNLQNAKMVVLSACETGLGDLLGHEGVFGLQRSFLIAGAKILIMSLWQVSDKETSEFMSLFYKNIVKDNDIKKAFINTQSELKSRMDPFHWGAFVLME